MSTRSSIIYTNDGDHVYTEMMTDEIIFDFSILPDIEIIKTIRNGKSEERLIIKIKPDSELHNELRKYFSRKIL